MMMMTMQARIGERLRSKTSFNWCIVSLRGASDAWCLCRFWALQMHRVPPSYRYTMYSFHKKRRCVPDNVIPAQIKPWDVIESRVSQSMKLLWDIISPSDANETSIEPAIHSVALNVGGLAEYSVGLSIGACLSSTLASRVRQLVLQYGRAFVRWRSTVILLQPASVNTSLR